MKFKILLAVLVLGVSASATAQFEPITEGYEVMLSEVRLPQSGSGTIGYKPCYECEYATTRVTENTQWIVNGESLTQSQFRTRMAAVRNRDDAILTIMRHLESDLIITVQVDLHDD